MSVRVEGRAVKLDHRKGTFVSNNGEQVAYDFHLVRILTAEYDTLDLRFDPGGPVPLPTQGDEVHYDCDLTVASGKIKLTPTRQLPYLYADLQAQLTP